MKFIDDLQLVSKEVKMIVSWKHINMFRQDAFYSSLKSMIWNIILFAQ